MPQIKYLHCAFVLHCPVPVASLASQSFWQKQKQVRNDWKSAILWQIECSHTVTYPLMGLTSLMKSGSWLFLVSGSKMLRKAATMLTVPKMMNGKVLLYASKRKKSLISLALWIFIKAYTRKTCILAKVNNVRTNHGAYSSTCRRHSNTHVPDPCRHQLSQKRTDAGVTAGDADLSGLGEHL